MLDKTRWKLKWGSVRNLEFVVTLAFDYGYTINLDDGQISKLLFI